MNARFFAPDAVRTGDSVALPDDEAQHLTRVLRLSAGDAVRVFNGRGDEFDALVEDASKTGVRVRVGTRQAPAAEAAVSITLVQAVLKGDKMDDVVRDAVMMGVAAIQPVVTTRTEISLAALERGNRVDRWQRIAVASAKQCHRAVVPAVLPPCDFEAVPPALTSGLSTVNEDQIAERGARMARRDDRAYRKYSREEQRSQPGRPAREVVFVHRGQATSMRLPNPALMLVEPGASSDVVPLGDVDHVAPREATMIVGPEGGWTSEEIERGAEACRLVTLGARTLRADAMALVALSALFVKWGEF